MSFFAWLKRFLGLPTRRNVSLAEEEDFITILKAQELWSSLESGELRCPKCGRVLSIDNIGGLSAHADRYEPFCSDPVCSHSEGEV